MKKKLLRLLALLLVVLIPLATLTVIIELLPNPYTKTYLGAFDAKYERLYEAEGKKIVFVGGSSLAFGLRSDLLEAELDGEYTVVNFGLYATLGTKFMMDMAKDAIDEGDIVILSPELNAQTYSLYFNPEAVLQATGGLSTKFRHLSLKDQSKLYYQYYRYAIDKLSYITKDNAPDPIGAYRADSFNEYCDMALDLPQNIMNNGVDVNMLIRTDETLLDDEFFDYVNEYAADLEKRGATVYFNYSPTNEMAIRSSSAARAEFQQSLADSLEIPLLGDIEEYLIDDRYFYDTNFHLNSAGALYFTDLLAKAIKTELDMDPVTAIEVPAPPPLAANTTVEVPSDNGPVDFAEYEGQPNNDYLECFEYTLRGGAYAITGVKTEYLGMTEVILPSVYEGKNITAVEANAFFGCTELKAIHIGTTYKSLEASSFAGCISLESIYLYEMDGNRISPPSEGLMDGTPSSVRICVPEGSNYSAGYTWSNYLKYFEYVERGE